MDKFTFEALSGEKWIVGKGLAWRGCEVAE